jgi:uncharacterized membrane protein YbhN (UPF0104 family)
MRKHFSSILKIAVTVLGLLLVVGQVDLGELWHTIIRAHVTWLGVGFLLVNASLVVRAYRWYWLLHSVGASIQFLRLIELYFVGNFFNTFLPSGFGGDVIRVMEVARKVPAGTATGTVILDRLTGLIMLFIMALFVIPLRPENFPSSLLLIILAGALGGVALLVFLVEGRFLRYLGKWLPKSLSPEGDGPVGQLFQAVQQCGWPTIIKALAISIFFNLILAAWWLACGLALRQQVAFSYYVLVMPILSVPMLIPSLSGLGPRELLAPTLFTVVGLTPETAVSLSLFVFVITRLSGVLGAPVYIYATLRDGRVWPNKQHSETVKPSLDEVPDDSQPFSL